SSPLFRERPTKRASRASSQRPSTKGVRVSSRRSESSSASSVSPYDARRRGATSHPSSHSQPVSPWSNPSTQPKEENGMKKTGFLLASLAGMLFATTALADTAVKLGVLNDRSGIYSDITGEGSVIAAQMAVEDFGAKEKGITVEIVSADH